MADDQDPEQKTEQPSQKRLDEAFKKGNVPNSREVGNFLLLFVFALVIIALLPSLMQSTRLLLVPFLSDADSLPTDQKGLNALMLKLVFGSMSILSVPLLGAITAVVAASVLQNGLIVTMEPMKPKWSRLSPLTGLKRIFSMRGLVETLKNLIKVGVVGYIAFLAVYPELGHIRQLPGSTTEALLIFLALLAKRMMIGILIAMFLIAIFDLAFQRFMFNRSMRMTKQELRDEYKQSEGDPIIKQRLRRLRQDRARRRMMKAVPKSDVVITNPTHFAVALQYDQRTMTAPKVVAKGQDLIALRIRDLAREHNVPIVENPPLARALYTSAELEQEIPVAHYEAVAKVISYIYQLKGKKLE